MIMQRPFIACCLLLSCISVPAWGESDGVRALQLVQLNPALVESAGLLAGSQPPSQGEPRRSSQFQLPEHTYASADASESGGERMRRGRLSVEERRALRRQINEVGSDLYAPRQ